MNVISVLECIGHSNFVITFELMDFGIHIDGGRTITDTGSLAFSHVDSLDLSNKKGRPA